MAALDFPASPTTGQLFSAANGVTYRYDGTIWLAQAGPGGGTGDFMAAASANFALGAVATVLWDTVQTGNSGSWYSTSTGRYTPPAGRYNIFTEIYGRGNAATMQLDVTLRKNGVVIATAAASTAASLFWTAVPIEVIVDANGTDWFDVQGAASAASTGNGRFLAFPLTGMQGPQGLPPTAGGGIIREVNVTTPVTTIDLFSLGVKSCMVLFRFAMGAANQTVFFQVATGSTVDISSNYYLQQMYTTGTTVAGSLSGPATQISMSNADTGNLGMVGSLTIPDLSLYKYLCDMQTTVSGGHYLFHQAFLVPVGGTTNGFRFSTSGTFAAGSFVRVVGWP